MTASLPPPTTPSMPPKDDRDRPLRLFAAVELPASWKAALGREAQTLNQAAPGFGRWVDPSLLHLTLVFLGNQAGDRVETITAALDAAAAEVPAFSMSPGSSGSFGGRGAIRVVWMGIEDTPRGALALLHAAITASLGRTGIVFDGKPFAPHVTLARARRDAGAAESAAMKRALTGRPSWGAHLAPDDRAARCPEITLVKSDLRPTGPIYTPLHRSPLR
jgi:RNA 2',3'-cyclic 3'-phosphodiesterase